MKSPSFQFYPKDFLADINVQVMTMEERGVYITMLCSAWIENGIPADPEYIKRLCNYAEKSNGRWEKIWSIVRPRFYEKKGRLFNHRLDKEKKKQKEWKKKSRLGGLASAESRRNANSLMKGGSASLAPKSQPKANSSSSSSSSSSKNNKPPGSIYPFAIRHCGASKISGGLFCFRERD